MSLLIPHSREYFIATTDYTSRNLSIVENTYLSDACIERMQATAFDVNETGYKKTFGMFLVNSITEYANKKADVMKHLMTACDYNHIPSSILSSSRSYLLNWIGDRLNNGETIEASWFDTYPYNMDLGSWNADTRLQEDPTKDTNYPMRKRFSLSLFPVPCVVTVLCETLESRIRCRFGVTLTTHKNVSGQVLMKDLANMFVDMQELASFTSSGTERFVDLAYPTGHADINFPVLGEDYQTFSLSQALSNDMLAHINAKWKGVPYDPSEGSRQCGETICKEYNWNACSDSTLFLLRAAEESGAFTWKPW